MPLWGGFGVWRNVQFSGHAIDGTIAHIDPSNTQIHTFSSTCE
jgi:hypothetical protein